MMLLFKEYIKIRIQGVELVALTFLMLILILTTTDTIMVWMFSFSFIVCSLFAFRILDDAFSVELDRIEHPNRTYLTPTKFIQFKKLTLLIFVIYLLGLGFVFSTILIAILTLLMGSLLLYGMFYRHRLIMKSIPLLKYPVLLYCISILAYKEIQIEVYLSFLLLMAGFDSFDMVEKNPKHIWIPILFCLGCGILLFKPWLNSINILFCLMPLFIIYRIRKKEFAPYFSILYFPIIFFILIH